MVAHPATQARSVPAARRSARAVNMHFICDDCPYEWSEQAAELSLSFCPSCDEPTEPYLWEELDDGANDCDANDGRG